MAALQLIILRDDSQAIERLEGLGEYAVLAEPNHFEGGADIISAVVQVTAITLPIIGMIIRERIRSNRYIKVKVKGVEISGAGLEDIGKLLRDLETK